MAKHEFARAGSFPHATGEHQQLSPLKRKCCRWFVKALLLAAVALTAYIIGAAL